MSKRKKVKKYVAQNIRWKLYEKDTSEYDYIDMKKYVSGTLFELTFEEQLHSNSAGNFGLHTESINKKMSSAFSERILMILANEKTVKRRTPKCTKTDMIPNPIVISKMPKCKTPKKP